MRSETMKPLGRLFDSVAGKALGKHGREWALLLAHWPEVAGEAAAFCRPLKLERPRGKGPASGLVLKLQAQPGRALELQHMHRQLIDRINAFFGHALIGRIVFVQAPFSPSRQSSRPQARTLQPDPDLMRALQGRIRTVRDPALAESLRRLAEGIAAKEGQRRSGEMRS